MSVLFTSPSRFVIRLIIICSVVAMLAACQSASNQDEAIENKAIVANAFERWKHGQGSFFDLLADDVTWTITGKSPVAKEYKSKKQFLDEVINPLNEKLSKKIVPLVKGLYAEGDMVVALWDGTATAKDGSPYFNTYSWYMRMKNGKIVDMVAFFDAIAFTEIWNKQ